MGLFNNSTITTNATYGDILDKIDEYIKFVYWCRLYIDIYHPTFIGLVGTFGLFGNTLSIVVLQLDKDRQRVATLLLQVLAVWDNIFLANTFLRTYGAAFVHGYVSTIVWSVFYISHMCSVWITVLIAFNRYIAVCHPFNVYKWCSMKRTCVQLVVLFVCILIYNIPGYIAFTPNIDWFSSDLFTTGYIIISDSIFMHVGPFLILGIFNTCICRELWRASRNREIMNPQQSGQSQDDKNVTVIMVVIMVICCLCHFPVPVFTVLASVHNNSYPFCSPLHILSYINRLLFVVNSAVNFIVYCLVRKRFRARMWACLRCKRNPTPL